jgi:hypothetical protein
MPDRHLRVLRDAARAAARRAREHDEDGPDATTPTTAQRGDELKRLAQRARKRLDDGLRRRAAPVQARPKGADGA